DKNRVNITQLSFYTDRDDKLYTPAEAMARFDQAYKKLSQQEYEELLANLEKQYTNDLAGFEQAKGFLDARMNFKYEALDDLGDRAYWKWHEHYGISLVVLTGAAQFTIETRVSAEAASTLDAAVKFAR